MPRVMSSHQTKLDNKMSFEYLIPDSSHILQNSQFGWQVAPIKYSLEIQLCCSTLLLRDSGGVQLLADKQNSRVCSECISFTFRKQIRRVSELLLDVIEPYKKSR